MVRRVKRTGFLALWWLWDYCCPRRVVLTPKVRVLPGCRSPAGFLSVLSLFSSRVRVFDLRKSESLCSLYAHQLGVSAVQMDDWKIVSGGEEGLVCVWDQRMGTKLWEMHAR